MNRAFADFLLREGLLVRVVTNIGGEDPTDSLYGVTRQPGFFDWIREIRRCDVIFDSGGIPVLVVLMMIVMRRPWIVIHHYDFELNVSSPYGRLKFLVRRYLQRFAKEFAVSEYLRGRFGPRVRRLMNPLDPSVFRHRPLETRDLDMIFVGRIIRSKGIMVLIDALVELMRRGITPKVTIVGDGPLLDDVRANVRDFDLKMVHVVGVHEGAELASLYARHRICVVPSLETEGFPLVALEAIACGCVVVGSAIGGLPEAIGPCGVTFPEGDHLALADRLEELSRSPDLGEFTRHAKEHLAPHEPTRAFQELLSLARGHP